MHDAPRNVLVTGGTGFIGSAVVRRLLEEGDRVTALDAPTTSRRENLPEHERLAIVEGDITDDAALANAMAGATHVVHLAAVVSVPESISDPEKTKRVNEEGTRAVFAAAKDAGVVRVVYASSAAVYGNDPTIPKREDMTLPEPPTSPYAASKIQNEHDAKEYADIAIGLRFFNVYGPRQRADGAYASLIPRWINAIRTRTAPELYGDGTQTRDFVHVRDVADAVALALAADVPSGSVYNIASGKECSLGELWAMMNAASGTDLKLVHLPPRAGDIVRSVADISRAHAELGFSPKVSFEEGLKELLS